MVSRSTSKGFPGFSAIHVLGDPCLNRPFRAQIDFGEKASAFFRSEEKPLGPVVARWRMGSALPSEVIWCTIAAAQLISAAIVDRFLNNGITGWGTFPVDLLGKGGEHIEGYFGLSVHGRCGPIDKSKSTRILKQMPGGVFPYWKGLYFDPDSWDGSAIFVSETSSLLFVVDTVKRSLEKAKIKNLRFVALDAFERSWD